MKKLNQFLAGITALCCIVSSVSCSTKNNGEETPNGTENSANTSTAEQIAEKSYKAIEFDVDLPLRYVDTMCAIGEDKIFISGTNEEGDSVMYVADKDFASFTEVKVDINQSENSDVYTRTAITTGGKILLLATITDYGDFELPDYNDPDFDFESYDFEAMQEAAQVSQKLYSIDADGKVLTEAEVKGIEKYADPDTGSFYSESFDAIGEDKVLVSAYTDNKTEYFTIDLEGNAGDVLDLGEEDYFYPSGMDRDGNFCFVTYAAAGSELRTFDCTEMKLTDSKISVEGTNYGGLLKGLGEYRIFLTGNEAFYGVKDDGTVDTIINWYDSDLTGDFIQGIVPVEGGDFIVYEQNWNTGGSTFYRLTKRDASEFENVKILNLACNYGGHQFSELVKEYNKKNTGYRIKIEDYSKYYQWDEESETMLNSPDAQLKQDIAAGKKIDILCFDSTSEVLNNLASKGALVDLYEMLGTNDDVKKDDIVEPVLKACEIDGKLYSLSPSFYVQTMVVKKKYCETENWTVDDLIKTCEKMPDGMKVFSTDNTKDSAFYNFITVSDYVDYSKATCSFDSPEFIKLLEFCNTFDSEDGFDWENASDDEMQKYWEEQEVAYRKDKALIRSAYISEIREYARTRYGEFNDEITFVGRPSADGRGTSLILNSAYGIMADSSEKQACWDFISSMFTEEYQESEEVYSIPVRKSAFEKKFKEAMDKPYYIDEDGKKVEYDDNYYIGNEEVKIPPLSKEDAEKLKSFILGINSSSDVYNEAVENIVYEEVQAFFKGEKSASETAKIIQNRVSILVSEQY